jgi:NADH-quinone oxidoreductase subunit J
MAAALVLIYAGAVLVTYVFVIMLAAEASPARESNVSGARSVLAEHDRVSREPVVSTIAGFAILGVLLFVIFDRSPETLDRKPYSVPLATQTLPASEQFAMAADVARPNDAPGPRPIVEGNSQVLGLYLFNNQMVGIQLAGLLLTISMIGAIVIAKKRIFLPAGATPAEPEVMHGPATPVDDNPHSIPVVGTRDPTQKEYPEN